MLKLYTQRKSCQSIQINIQYISAQRTFLIFNAILVCERARIE